MQVLQPQGLFINKPFYTSIHKPCFYTSPAFKQALLLHKSVFTQDLLLHKPCFYTSAVFTQALLLHKTCFYTNAVFTQALSLHKHCLYTRPAFTQKRFYTRPPFTQTLSLHKLCLYTSIAFIQALLLHNDILLTKAFCNLQTGNRLEGRRNAEGCKYGKIFFVGEWVVVLALFKWELMDCVGQWLWLVHSRIARTQRSKTSIPRKMIQAIQMSKCSCSSCCSCYSCCCCSSCCCRRHISKELPQPYPRQPSGRPSVASRCRTDRSLRRPGSCA